MSVKMRQLSPLERGFLCSVGLNDNYDDAVNKENPKMVEYFPGSKTWMAMGTTSIYGNTIKFVESVAECKLVEDIKPSLTLTITNKLPVSIFKEVIGSFNRIYKKWGTECAAQIYQNRSTKELWVYYPKQKVTGAHVKYDHDDKLNTLRNDNSLIMELHSHDSMGAFWSGEDDKNEKDLGFYMVIGNFGSTKCSYKLRCKYKNISIDMNLDQLFDFEEGDSEDTILNTKLIGDGNKEIEDVCEKETYSYKYTSKASTGNYLYRGGYGSNVNSVKQQASNYADDYEYLYGDDYSGYGYGDYDYGYGYRAYGSKDDALKRIHDFMTMNPNLAVIDSSCEIYDDMMYISEWNYAKQAYAYGNWVKRRTSDLNNYSWEFVYEGSEDNTKTGNSSSKSINRICMFDTREASDICDKWSSVLAKLGIDRVDTNVFLDTMDDEVVDILSDKFDISTEDVIGAIASRDYISVKAINNIMLLVITEGDCTDMDEYTDIISLLEDKEDD